MFVNYSCIKMRKILDIKKILRFICVYIRLLKRREIILEIAVHILKLACRILISFYIDIKTL